MGKDKVLEFLKVGSFQNLIGLSENEWLECKQAPYFLDTPRNKRELAKDVAALANASGGVILLGVKTKKSDTHHGDEVKEIRPCEQNLIDLNDYHHVLKDWIYPNLEDVEIKWYASDNEPTKGIIAILVPQQPLSLAPFLLTKTVDENDRFSEILFGYCERKRANVEPTNASRLHTIIKDGLRFESISDRFDSLEQTMQEIAKGGFAAREQSLTEKKETVSKRIQDGLLEGQFVDHPYIAFSVSPEKLIDVTSIFEGRDSELVKLLDSPPTLRYSGFDLSTDKTSKVLKGRLRRSLYPEYKLLELWRDGTLIFIASGGMDHLAWGKYRNTEERLRINDYALIETSYLFCDLGKRIFSTIKPLPESFLARVELQNMSNGGQPCTILSTQRLPHRMKIAPGDGEKFEFQIGPEFFEPGIAAFQFASKIYEWFGVDYDQIPLTGRVNGKFCIDRDKILALV